MNLESLGDSVGRVAFNAQRDSVKTLGDARFLIFERLLAQFQQ
jgi:hypothetical protein